MKRLMITHILIAGALVCAAGCKKKEGESAAGGTSSGTPAPAKAADKPGAPKSTGIPECDAYLKAADKFATCDKLPPEQKQLYGDNAVKDRENFGAAKDKAAAAEQCKSAMKDLADGAKYRNCPIE